MDSDLEDQKDTEDKKCPECGGEITFGFGLAGGTDSEGNPTSYLICLDCDWQDPNPKETICCPFGLVEKN